MSKGLADGANGLSATGQSERDVIDDMTASAIWQRPEAPFVPQLDAVVGWLCAVAAALTSLALRK
jgi:hypothetical protein